MTHDLLILGAGAAGMMAAIAAGETAHAEGRPLRIALLEKNIRPGIKVLVCGGGRCNFTNAGTVDFLIAQFGRNGRFLTPALRALDNDGLRDFFTRLGVPSHVEHDGKVYPNSNQAKSVVDALVRRMETLGIEVHAGPGSAAATAQHLPEGFRITTVDARTFDARSLLLAVGGMSYQRMGTTGDGYRLATSLGHTIVTPRPAIVGLLTAETDLAWMKPLQGLAVPDVEIRIIATGPLPTLATGKPTPSINDMLFTHFGLSGPAVLNMSEIVAELLEKTAAPVTINVDFARRLPHEALHALLRSWQQTHGKKQLKTMLSQHAREVLITSTSPDQTAIADISDFRIQTSEFPFSLPARLAIAFCQLENIPPEQPCSSLTSPQIHRLVQRIKNCRFSITATRGFKEAMVTAGGVKLAEVDPRTMHSKITPGLFLTGEVLDLTGPSGGYNLQLAFSTGHLAGTMAGRRLSSQ